MKMMKEINGKSVVSRGQGRGLEQGPVDPATDPRELAAAHGALCAAFIMGPPVHYI